MFRGDPSAGIPAMLNRRAFLGAAAALGAASVPRLRADGTAPLHAAAAGPSETVAEATLEAAPGAIRIADDGGPPLPVWGYNGASPGPALRYRPGDTARIRVRNALPRPTTVHWHGLRVPNAMDGVPGLTQDPIPPGGEFLYEFPVRNPGTYWYHPHFQSAEQLDRGLAGAIVVEDAAPYPVDRDLTWVIDDWRLDAAGNVREDFGNLHDASHAGRLGNVATVNGRIPDPLSVQAGERIRLRLVNVANARVFALQFAGHAPVVIALDGQAVRPHAPPGGQVVLGPSMRADLVLDCAATPGSLHPVRDRAYPRTPFELTALQYLDDAPLRAGPPPPVPALPAPDLPEPDLARAEHHALVLEGGAMGGMAGAMFHGEHRGIRELARLGKVWAFNGVVAHGHAVEPWLSVATGTSHVLEVENRTAFPHPLHLHGHPVKVLARDGVASPFPVWRDSVLLMPRERVDLAFVADNPGLWMIHCHIPEHQEAGMMGVVRVG